MTRFVVIGMLALMGLVVVSQSGAAQDPAAPPGEADHHAAVNADAYPWSAVAKLFNSVGGSCTGAVIARDKVLTAGHCVYVFRTRRFLPPEAIHLLIGYERGDYRVHAKVLRYRIGPGYDPQEERRSAGSDWAVLDLDGPLPPSVTPLDIAMAPAPASSAIMVGGFARDRAYQMTADESCKITGSADGGRLITHDCFLAPGDSGAPLLIRRSPQRVEVLGVAIGIWSIEGRSTAIGAPVSSAILAAGLPPP